MKLMKKTANVLLAFVLAFGLCPIAPFSAMAETGNAAPSDFSLRASGLLSNSENGFGGLSAQAEGDLEAGTWGDLQTAINNVEDGKTIYLVADITAGPDNKTLVVKREGVSFAIDLAGHTINRNLTSQDDNKGHVFDVNEGTLTIRDSSTGQTGKITGGYDKNGGGIVIGGEGHLIVESGAITGNQAYNGGGIFVYGELTMTGGSVSGNIGGDCGGIYNHGGTIKLSDVTISGNSTRGAGGAGVNNKGTATLTNCTISNNVSDAEGGGVYNGEDGNITLNSCTITGNKSESGGGICTYGSATLVNTNISDNETNTDGGAIRSYGKVTLQSCIFERNKAAKSGGAIRVNDGTVSAEVLTLHENRAEAHGGGIYINNDATLNLTDVSITENTGMNGGGGIWVAGGTKAVNIAGKVVVADNKANDVCLVDGKKLTVSDPLTDGANVNVVLQDSTGTFTKGFHEKNPGEDPEKYFEAQPGFSVLANNDGEAMVVASDWVHLQKQIDAADNGSTITLDKDWKAAPENSALKIRGGKTITIDLNGHKLDRNLGKAKEAVDGGSVIEVNGALTVKDSAGSGQITGGYSYAGGGIHVLPGATCAIEGGFITENRATNGGGIYSDGALTITGGFIERNSADSDGGGIYTLGVATVAGAFVMANTASNGAGIYAGSGTTEVSGDTRITSNTAKDDGGGIFLNAGKLNLFDCNIALNRADEEGGGIHHCGSATLNVKGAPVVVSNTAPSGGNILLGENEGNAITIVDKLADTAKLDVATKNTLSYAITYGLEGKSATPKGTIDNFSYNAGGTDQLVIKEDGELYHKRTPADIEVNNWKALQAALDDEEYKTIALSGDIVAEDEDKTLWVTRSVTIDLNGKKINRNLRDCDQDNGSVLELDNGDEDSVEITIKDSLGAGAITGGFTGDGGGIYIHPGATLYLEGGSIENNIATNCGAGIYNGGKLVMRGGQLAYNEASACGGGIYSANKLEATGGIIRYNKSYISGGGIYSENAHSGARMLLSGLTILKNTARVGGGGIYVDGIPNGSITDSIIDDNATEGYGGGVVCHSSGEILTISNTVIGSNTAKGNASEFEDQGVGGGGIFIISGSVDMTGGALTNNEAKQGGAVTLTRRTQFQADGVRIQDNKATDGSGGAILNVESTLSVSNSEIRGNEAKVDGGAVYSFNGLDTRTKLESCVVSDNTAHSCGGAVGCESGLLTVLESTFTGNRAVERGGAIYSIGANPFVMNTTITDNSADLEVGGIYLSDFMAVQGKVIVQNNSGGDVHIVGISDNMATIRVAGSLEGSWIGVSGNPEVGLICYDFQKYNSGADPADYFFAKPGYSIVQGWKGDAEIVKSEWPQLQKKIRDTEDGGTLKLDRDWKAIDSDDQLKVPEGKTVTIDLNGHTIDRNRGSSDKDGHVIEVMDGATLIVTDSSAGKDGKITGGYAENGGGINVQPNATCTIEAGRVTGNQADNGGGVYVHGTLNVTGGSIDSNKAENGGGVYSVGTVNVTGGSITSNEGTSSAGGIGFKASSTLNVGGKPSVTGNIAPAGKNILVSAGSVITVVSELGEGAKLDVATQDPPSPLTSGLTETGNDGRALSVFTYNEATDRLVVMHDELYLIRLAPDVSVSSWKELQNAINADENQWKLIGLQNDITATDDDDRLHLKGKNVNIDLCGHKLDRHLDDSDSDGHVFELSDNSSLTIMDSAGAGMITGGYAAHGGAINIHEGSTCTIESGAIVGNRASKSGGGIFVYGTLIMTGGFVAGNKGDDGGGIYVHEHGTINLENVTLMDNNASDYGGGAINNKGVATLKNCTVKGNRADEEGGGIYNGTKELTLTDCTITGNSTENGGGIYSFGTVTLNNTAVTGNKAGYRGGGVYVHKTFNMTGGAITDNTGVDCGGIYNDAGTITLTGVDISGNRATEDGGAGVNNKGKATITNCTISKNSAKGEGGGVYANGDSDTTIVGSTISGNETPYDGGGICSYGKMAIDNTSIDSNKAGHSGGGLLMHFGSATVTGSVITNNEAKGLGGGAYVNDEATISLVGGTIINNSAFEGGGGIWVSQHAKALNMEGAVVVSDNNGGSDVYLKAGNKIHFTAALQKGAKVGVYQEDELGTPFTKGYGDKNPTVDPYDYFFSNEGYVVHKKDNEAILKLKDIDEKPFIETNSQVVRDYNTLNSKNWMAGISGERRLNEINLPGTHDSGTAKVEGNISTGNLSIYAGLGGAALGSILGEVIAGPLGLIGGGLFGGLDTPIEVSKFFQKFANCQTAYIDEQLDMGVRSLDIRLNTFYAKQGYPVKKRDDGESLYLLHGKDPNAGSYFCKDHDDDFLTFKTTLGWIKEFLKEHPTETIIMGVQIDSVDDVYDEGMERIQAHLRDLSMEINPSTGEPYLYMEDGVLFKKYTAYPQLKDCRGKIVLSASSEDAELIGGLVSGIGLKEVDRPEGSYKDAAAAKINNLTNFYAYYGGRDLPTNLDTRIDYYYSVGTNGTDTRVPPQDTPLDIADDVLDAMFGEGGVLLNREGTYLGLVNMDAANPRNCKLVWGSNYFDGLEYCTVTAKSGLSGSDTKTYSVIKGTPITIPECIYDVPSSTGVFFEGWTMTKDKDQSDGGDYQPGASFTVTEDVTFTAQWSSGERTPVAIVWKDGHDKDGLQPDSVKLKVNDTQEFTVTKYDNWRHVYPGKVETVEPVMEGDWGAKYTSSVTSLPFTGFLVTLTHTPADKTTVAGTVMWNDGDVTDAQRPDSVELHLYANDKAWGSKEVFASDDWKFDFGEQPAYMDGTAVYYRIMEDKIDGYATSVNGYVVLNIAHKASRLPTGFVYWADDENAAKKRPDSVTVNLLKDGVKIDSTTVTENSDGEWPFYFDMGNDDSEYTITQESIEGYETVIQKDGVNNGVTYAINKIEGHEHTPTKLTIETEPATCITAGSRNVVECCSDCTEVLSETTEEIPALGHDWGAWTTTHEPSETEMGVRLRLCKRNPLHFQFRAIPKTDHVHGLVHVEAKDATCIDDGNIEYWKCSEGDDPCGQRFTDEAGSKWIPQEDTVVHALGHSWGAWETSQQATETSWGTEKRTCANDATHIEYRQVPKTKHVHGLAHVDAKDATCTDDGNIEYWKCSEGDDPCELCFTDEAGTKQIQQEDTVVNAIGHSWGAWTVTKPATETEQGLMTRECSHDSTHVQTRVIPEETHAHGFAYIKAKAATCTDDGNIDYWKCSEGDNPCGLCFKDFAGAEWVHEDDVAVHALGHDWDGATYAWNKDDTKVTAKRVCKRDLSHFEDETTTGTKNVVTPATCTEKGSATVASQLFKNEGFMPQTKTVELPALGHEWGEPAYDWAADGSSMTAKRTCGREGCGAAETEVASLENGKVTKQETTPATCTEKGETTYTATFENAAFAKQTKTLADVEPLGHEWGEPSYEWAADGSSVAAKRACTREGCTASEAEEASVANGKVAKQEAKPATCEQPGETTYTATFENAAFAEQEKTIADVEPLGHEWGEPSYEWAADGSSVAAKRACTREGCTASEAEEASVANGKVAKQEAKPATCEQPGETTYTATFENAAFAKQEKTLADVKPLGHAWGEWIEKEPATESADGLEMRTCSRCGESETREIPATYAYRFTAGDGAEWTKGSSDGLTFTIKRTFEDASTFRHFTGVKIDGKDVASSGYDAKSGSVILTLKPTILETLSTGDHEVTTVFDDGNAAAKFVVKAAPTQEAAKESKTSGASTTSGANAKSNTAKTGDAIPVAAIALTVALIVLALIVLVVARRKRKE